MLGFSRSASRQSYLALLLLLATSGLEACRSHGTPPSAAKFDWDSDLAPLEIPKTDRTRPTNNYDRNFCKNMAPGSCLSLILRGPREELIQDLGLSTLALGAESKSFRLKMDEACLAAWTDYKAKYVGDAIRPLRNQVVRKVEKMRCIYLFMNEEVASEDSKLADNEIGLSVRLTKFDINAETKGGQIRGIGLALSSINSVTDFRSAFVYSGSDLRQTASGWQPAAGLDVKPISVKSQIDRSINWNIDLAALKENLAKIETTAPNADANVGAFVGQAKTLVGNMASLNNPLQSSLLLINIGYNAFRGLCGEDVEKCKVYTTKDSKNQALKDDLADLIPSSETNELLRLAMIRSVQGVLDSLFTQTNADQIRNKFEIN